MIPWRRHNVDQMDSRKFRRIPREDRLLAFGAFDRLCDLIGQFGEWDELVGSRGDPWRLEEIADSMCLDVAVTRKVIDQLAEAELIDKPSWQEKSLVKVPAIILYASEWFRRTNRARVEEHLRTYGLAPEGDGDTPRPLGDSQGTLGLRDGTGRDVTERDGTKRKRRRSSADAPSKRIRYDVKSGTILGINDDDRSRWKETYPNVDLEREIRKCEDWLRDNERTDIAATLRTWFGKSERDAKHRPPDSGPAASGRRTTPPRSADSWAGRKGGVTRRG